MKQISRILILLFVIMLSSKYVSAQSPTGEMMTYQLTENADTIRLNRKYGDWWFGIQGGGQLNSYFGDLNVRIFKQIENPFNKLIDYSSGSGGGFFVGGLLEWKPRGQKWGAALNVSAFDSRSMSSTSSIKRDSSFNLDADFQQFVISPAAIYHLPIEGLHLTAGLNFEIMSNNSGHQNMKYDNINHTYKTDFDDKNFGYGAFIGFGYDFFIADFRNKSRLLLTPFADFNIRSSIVDDNSSSFYSTTVRFGFKMKFGSDEVVIDTLPFDKNYYQPPNYLATVKSKVGIEFTTYLAFKDIPSVYIDVINEKEIGGEIGEVVVSKVESSKNVEAEIPAARSKLAKEPQVVKNREIVIKKGVIERISYPSSASTQLTPDLKNYLNKVAEYLRQNPKARVIIVGHSDNRGNLEQRTFRARERAKNVERYLLYEMNIQRDRVIANWKGALFAIATNDTEDGRRQNRRVEILIEE